MSQPCTWICKFKSQFLLGALVIWSSAVSSSAISASTSSTPASTFDTPASKSVAVQSSSVPECSAPIDYLTLLERFKASQVVNQDYSCLISYAAISKQLSNYQLVDIRLNPSDQINDSWLMNVDELRHKSFLQNRSLLLLGDSFSRVSLASDCAQLRKAGFNKVAFLIGGVTAWQQATTSTMHARLTPVKKTSPQELQTITAQQLIFEYFNGHLSVISASKNVSDQLTKIGITQFYELKTHQASEISDVVINSSKGGFDPVVFIGDTEIPSAASNLPQLSNLYYFPNHVETLSAQLTQAVLTDNTRNSDHVRPYCAK